MSKFKILFVLLLMILPGCSSNDSQKTKINFYLNPDGDTSTIGRATLVGLDNKSGFPQISVDVTEAMSLALQKNQLFGLNVIRQEDPAWNELQLDVNNEYTLEQLSLIRKNIKSDALMIGTVTTFKPYPQMAIGLRLKLIDLRNGQLLWALEQIWDTTDKITADRIKKYYKDSNLFTSPTLQEKIGTISSLKFVKFVTYEAAETLRKDR